MNVEQLSIERTNSSKLQNAADTRLQGRRLVLARVVWVAITLLSLGVFVANLTSYFVYLHSISTAIITASPFGQQLTPNDVRELQRLGLSINFYAWLYISVLVLLLLVYVLVGVVLFWRKSDDRVALLASLTLVQFPLALSPEVATLPLALMLLTIGITFFGNACLALFICLFPSGQFVPRWTRWLAVAWIICNLINFLPAPRLNNSLLILINIPFLVLLGSMLAVQIYRYRRVSTPVQRQQTKWVVFGIALLVGGSAFLFILIYVLLPRFFLVSPLTYAFGQMLFLLLWLLIPLSIGFAILHAHLWEIDRLVSRTLVYSTLTVLLALIYFGLIFSLQSLLRALTGQISQAPLVLVGSTLLIYAIFRPLRSRIQQVIDRRFYRRKYETTKVVEAFSATLRNEVDLDQLSKLLMEVVQETMEPEHVSLWLRKSKRNWRDTILEQRSSTLEE
jgi:hypothetical protein